MNTYHIHSTRALRRVGTLALILALLMPIKLAAADFALPEGLTKIGAGAFQGCVGLGDVVIPESVTVIEQYAFADCEGMTSILVPSSVKTLGDNALGRRGAEHTIIVHPNSAAERYANDYGLKYELEYTRVEWLLKYAHGMLGADYDDYDCVIFLYTCYKNALGIRIQNTCPKIQNNSTGVRIDNIADLMPGDIICWRDDVKEYCTHVGMYVGAGTIYSGTTHLTGVFIESSQGYGEVRYNRIDPKPSSYYNRNFLCAWRIVND